MDVNVQLPALLLHILINCVVLFLPEELANHRIVCIGLVFYFLMLLMFFVALFVAMGVYLIISCLTYLLNLNEWD